MARPKVFVARKIAQEALDIIAREAEVELWQEEGPTPRDILINKVRDAEGMLSMLTEKVDFELMDAAPRLKAVSNLAVGFDNIDIGEATRRGIVVGNTPGVLTNTTADFAWALIMAAGRRVAEADRYTRDGKWKTWGPMILLGQDVHDATLGIIGCGRIGFQVAKRARGFNMKVLYYDIVRRKPEEEKEVGLEFIANMHDLLRRSDFVTVHVPLTPDTRRMISTAEFDAMKPTAVFVNTSRGPVVDPKALYEALKTGKIFAAGLDVTDPEPISMEDPLLTLENITIAPHIASGSVATRTKMAIMAAENLLAGLKGQMPPNCLNPEALGKKR
jgi:glyoxylate reductase